VGGTPIAFPAEEGGDRAKPTFQFPVSRRVLCSYRMYVIGVLVLMASLVVTHWTEHHEITRHVEATAH
jgi:hypothetical protein